MHRGDHLSELFSDECRGASALLNVAGLTTLQTDLGGTIQKNCEIEEAADGRSPEEPKTLNQNDRGRFPEHGFRKACVVLEIITGKVCGPAGTGGHNRFLEQGPVYGLGMIKVDCVPAGGREL